VNDWELATRLSYFLWSSAPDAELRAVAASGKLRNPDVLAAQCAACSATRVCAVWRPSSPAPGCTYTGSMNWRKERASLPDLHWFARAMYEETIRFFTDFFPSATVRC